jgi:hypothetical protein
VFLLRRCEAGHGQDQGKGDDHGAAHGRDCLRRAGLTADD